MHGKGLPILVIALYSCCCATLLSEHACFAYVYL